MTQYVGVIKGMIQCISWRTCNGHCCYSLVLESCLTLCNFSQARILGASQSRDTRVDGPEDASFSNILHILQLPGRALAGFRGTLLSSSKSSFLCVYFEIRNLILK